MENFQLNWKFQNYETAILKSVNLFNGVFNILTGRNELDICKILRGQILFWDGTDIPMEEFALWVI